MRSFKLSDGRSVDLAVTINTIKRVKSSEHGVDLTRVDALYGDPPIPLMSALQGLGPILLVDVLYLCCKPSLDAQGISDEQFGELIVGDPLTHASDAFFREWESFFHGLNRADAVQTIQAGNRVVKAAIARATELTTTAASRTCAQIAAFSPTATGSPESSGLTPAT